MNSERLGDRYELGRLIGSGGMSAVYEGVDVATGGRVAIKILHEDAAYTSDPPSSFSRLRREARAIRSIETPHIVHVLDAGMHPDTGAPYLILELLEGEDLQRTIDKWGP